MSSIGSRFKVLSITLLALYGSTALMAGGAQGNWLESGKEVTVNKNLVVKAHTTYKMTISKSNLEFRCTTLKSEGLKLLASSTTGEGNIAFSDCLAFQTSDGKEQKNCKPTEPIVGGSTASLKLLAKTKNGTLNNYILFGAKSGKPFTTITLPEACALAETSEISGSFVAECGTLVGGVFTFEDCKTERAEHLLQVVNNAAMFESDGKGGHMEVKENLKFGENETISSGIVGAELESKNSWAGHV